MVSFWSTFVKQSFGLAQWNAVHYLLLEMECINIAMQEREMSLQCIFSCCASNTSQTIEDKGDSLFTLFSSLDYVARQQGALRVDLAWHFFLVVTNQRTQKSTKKIKK